MNYPSVSAVATDLIVLRGQIEEDGAVDVRLRVHATGWTLQTCKPEQDRERRGYLGAATVDRNSNCHNVAIALIDQARQQRDRHLFADFLTTLLHE